MKACRAFRSALPALLDGELALERTLECEDHARSCAACGAELARSRALEQALQALPQPPIERLDLARNLQAVLARLDAPALPRPRSLALRLVPFAAAAGLAALLGWRFTRAPEPAPPAALAQAGESEAALDEARLSSARAAVCAALRESEPGFDPACDDAHGFAAACDARTLELARSGWPLAALIQTAATDADPELAARALRWLGVHAAGASRVRAALLRAELAPSAVAALLDLDAAGVDELRRAPQSAALRALVLQQHARAPRPALAPWIEDSLARGRTGGEERGALLEALGACGAEAVPALLRLSTRGALEPDVALSQIARIADADKAIGRVLADARGSGIDEHLLLLCVAEVGTSGGWEWVEREARDGRHETDALLALARGTPEALAALLRLRAASGARPDGLQRTLELVLRERPDSAAALVGEASRTEQAELYELVSAAPEPALVPTLLELAGSEALPEPDRRWALLLGAELGRPEDLAQLAALFPRLRERTLRAACLIALHSIGGSPPVEQALERCSTALRQRVRALLEDPAGKNGTATTLARLARAIESSLPAPQP